MPVSGTFPALPTRQLPPLPRPDAPLVDPRTGQIDQTWFRYFQSFSIAAEEWRAYHVAMRPVLDEMRSLIP